MRRRRSPEVVAGRVNADGSIAAGDGFTVSKFGTGQYSVFFASSFRLIAATVNRADTGLGGAMSVAHGGSSMNVYSFATNTAAATDLPFSFTATGTQQ